MHMDLQQLQATRAQLIYEFGEIEYERRLHVQRIQFLEQQYNLKVTELQEIESQIDKVTQSLQNFANSEFLNEKNDENILKSE